MCVVVVGRVEERKEEEEGGSQEEAMMCAGWGLRHKLSSSAVYSQPQPVSSPLLCVMTKDMSLPPSFLSGTDRGTGGGTACLVCLCLGGTGQEQAFWHSCNLLPAACLYTTYHCVSLPTCLPDMSILSLPLTGIMSYMCQILPCQPLLPSPPLPPLPAIPFHACPSLLCHSVPMPPSFQLPNPSTCLPLLASLLPAPNLPCLCLTFSTYYLQAPTTFYAGLPTTCLAHCLPPCLLY